MDDSIVDLYTVELVEGLTLRTVNGTKPAVYKTVMLRESCEAYLHAAIREVQELRRTPDGSMRLVHNEALYEASRIAQHIDRFVGGGPDLLSSDIDISVLGKLHPLDVMLIAERLLQIELAAQLRWNLITQDEYDLILMGKASSNSKPLTPHETLESLKKITSAISRITSTSMDSLRLMPLAELESTLKALAETTKG